MSPSTTVSRQDRAIIKDVHKAIVAIATIVLDASLKTSAWFPIVFSKWFLIFSHPNIMAWYMASNGVVNEFL